MATTEEFLISLGIAPGSAENIVSELAALKTRIESTTIELQVASNAAAVADEVGAAAQKAGVEADHAMALFDDGINDVTTGLKELKTSLLAVGAAATVIAGLGFGEAAEESRGLARANVILGDTTEELAKKQELLRQIADETGITYSDAANALFDVASAGFEGEEAVDAIRAAAQAAVPAGIELATAFNAIATAQVNFGLSSEEAGDKLVRISDLTRGTLANVSAALGRIGPTAASVGISLDEVGAAFATITNTGESAEEASTLLFNAINKFLAPADEAARALDRIGVVTGDAAFKNQTLAEKLDLVAEAAKKGGFELGKIFDIRASRAIRAITNNMDKFQDNMEKVADSTGRTREGLEAFFQSLGPKWDKFKTQVTNVATAIGTDLLEAIVPVTTALGEFLTDNQDLFRVLTLGVVTLTALTAAYLAYVVVSKQVAAAQLVVSGVSRAVTAALALEKGALLTSTSAWLARKAALLADAKVGVVKLFKRIIAVLTLEAGAVWLGIKAWAVRIALGVGRILKATALAIGAVIKALFLQTSAIWTNTAALEANVAVQLNIVGVLSKMKAVLLASAGAASILTVAVAAVGVAFVGWKLGRWIDGVLGLGEATDRVAKGQGSWLDVIKSLVTIGPIHTLLRAKEAAAILALSKITAGHQNVLDADADAQRRFNEFVARGLSEIEAFSAAVNGLVAELGGLQKLERRGLVLTDNELRRKFELEILIAKQREEQLTKGKRLLTEAAAIKDATEQIKSTQDSWTSSVAATEKAYSALRLGELSQSLVDVASFEASFKTVTTRLKSFATQLASLEAHRADLLSKGAEAAKGALEENAVAIADKVGEINEIIEKLDKDIVVINEQILANGRSFITRLQAQADEETEAYRKAADGVIKEEERKLREVERILKLLTAARDESVRTAERFVQRLEEAELQRRDPQLLKIIRLEREYAEVIKAGIPDQVVRAKTLAALRLELERLSSATSAEAALRRGLVKVEEDLAAARASEQTEGSREREAELLEEENRLTEALADAEAKRAVRRQKAEAAFKTAVEGSTAAVQAFEDREAKIAELEAQRILNLNNLKDLAEQLRTVEGEIETKLEGQVTQAKALVAEQLHLIANAKQFSELLEAGRSSDPAQFEARIKVFREQLKESFENLTNLSLDKVGQNVTDAAAQVEDLAGQSGAVADFLFKLKNSVSRTSTAIIEDNQVIVPAAQAVTETFNDLQSSFEPSTDALRDMLAATQDFAPAIERFTDETVEKLGGVTSELKGTTVKVDENTARLERLETAGGGANGLPQ